jgi:hypothetical protein
MRCAHCFISFTPQWRKINNDFYCNSCGCCLKRKKKLIPVEQIYAKVLMDISYGK